MSSLAGSGSLALTLTVLMVAALFGLGPAASADSHATEIGCTTIEESGVYHLTSDLSGAERYCIQILADDVTIDGQGHTISDAHSGVVMEDTYDNVTVRNLNIRDTESRGIWIMDGNDHTIQHVDVRNAGGNGITLGQGAYSVAIEDITLAESRDGLFLGAANNVTVDGATIRDNDESGLILYDYSDLRLADATISGNAVGIDADLGGAVNATGLELRDNDVGILVEELDPARIDIHESVIAGNDVGVQADRFQRRDEINLTHNYWGAADGPSSVGGGPVADPMTGALANGSGDSIGGIDGEAVARFDPWLVVPALGDEFAGPPQDLDEDGLYEDVNGDGAVDVGDAQALFAFEDSATVQENAALFDFNEDGDVNVGDAQALFARVTTEDRRRPATYYLRYQQNENTCRHGTDDTRHRAGRGDGRTVDRRSGPA